MARIVAERAFLLLFGIVFRIAGSALLAWVVASAGLLVATLPMRGPDAPAWLDTLTRAWLWMSGTFLATAVLLFAARPPQAAAELAQDALPQRLRVLLGVSLVALPVYGYAQAGDLVALWREILVLLDRVGLWNAFETGGANSGLVLMPVFAALYVPGLEASAAFFLIAVPPGLLALLATRSPLLPWLFARMAVCQAGLVLASLIGADAFSRLATEFAAAMTASGDAEVLSAMERLHRADGVLRSTARGFVVPALGYLLWVPVLLLARRDASPSVMPSPGPDTGTDPGHPPAWDRAPHAPFPGSPAPLAPDEPAARFGLRPPGAFATDRRVRIACVALGALLLSSAATHATRSRARYASSDPPSGAILASPPAAVRVRFDRALDPSSSLYVDRTAPGEAALRVGVSSGLDPADPERRTLRADLAAAPAGRYRLQWHALPASGGGVSRFGSLVFAAGLPALPEDEPTFEEHDSGQRRWRRTVAGGAIFVLLGLLLSRLPRPR